MQNFIQKGDAIYVPAPAGGVLSSQVVVYGKLVGIAPENAAPGVTFALWLVGIYTVPKLAAQSWNIGDEIYFDTVALVATNVTNANTVAMGHATAAVAAGAGLGPVRLARLSS